MVLITTFVQVVLKELWSWIDSWAGKTEKNRLISSILLKSRKRDITIAYSAQSIMQVVRRVRDVTDFIAYPIMSADGTFSRIEIFRGSKPTLGSKINPSRYFNVEPVVAMYNTYEEIQPVKEEQTEFVEYFKPISENPAWLRYLKEEKRIKSEQKMKELSLAVQNTINPWGYTSEKQRKVEEDYAI